MRKENVNKTNGFLFVIFNQATRVCDARHAESFIRDLSSSSSSRHTHTHTQVGHNELVKEDNGIGNPALHVLPMD